ncbi:hypothetical protein Tco_1559026, partial [Tanacetum coccineum]
KISSINFNVFTLESVINDPTHLKDPIDAASAQDMYKEKGDVQEGDADVAACSKDKKKGKNIQEGDADVVASSKDKKKGKDVQDGSRSESAA